jgi:hypothetical protein
MCVVCVLRLIVVPLPPGEHPFAVKINNNNYVLYVYVNILKVERNLKIIKKQI